MVDDGSGWMETQPDGFQYYYDSTGKVTKLANHVGNVWTISYVGGTSRIEHVLNPASQRTTFHYDGSNKIQAIQDSTGRRTTLTVSSNQLTKFTSPELCESSFAYDGSGRLSAEVSPSGDRTTFSYDGSSRVTNIQYPDNARATYTYSGNTTVFSDPRAKVTTLAHSASKLLETVIDPLGKRTTLTWTGRLVETVTNPLNEVTTYAYKTFSGAGDQATGAGDDAVGSACDGDLRFQRSGGVADQRRRGTDDDGLVGFNPPVVGGRGRAAATDDVFVQRVWAVHDDRERGARVDDGGVRYERPDDLHGGDAQWCGAVDDVHVQCHASAGDGEECPGGRVDDDA